MRDQLPTDLPADLADGLEQAWLEGLLTAHQIAEALHQVTDTDLTAGVTQTCGSCGTCRPGSTGGPPRAPT